MVGEPTSVPYEHLFFGLLEVKTNFKKYYHLAIAVERPAEVRLAYLPSTNDTLAVAV